jgi:hypothetical protein
LGCVGVLAAHGGGEKDQPTAKTGETCPSRKAHGLPAGYEFLHRVCRDITDWLLDRFFVQV